MPNAITYRRRIQSGLCTQCGYKNDRHPKTQCSHCFEAMTTRQRKPEWLAKNKLKNNLKCRIWYSENKKKQLKATSNWRKNNPEKVKAANGSQAKYRNDRRKKHKIILDAIKIHYGCMNPNCCWKGILKPYCMDFHHVLAKQFNISPNYHYGLEKLSPEINKCAVLCAVCHRLVTWDNLDISQGPTCCVDNKCQVITHNNP